MHQLLLLCYDGTLIIVQHSPVIMNRPWSSPTPLIPPLAEGRLATSFQALPPSFSRISVYFNAPPSQCSPPFTQCSPPATTYTCRKGECKYQHSLFNSNHTTEPSDREKCPQACSVRPWFIFANDSKVPSCLYRVTLFLECAPPVSVTVSASSMEQARLQYNDL